MVEKTIEISMLYDFYGELLTPRQKDILRLHYEEDYSLSEIAEDKGISRQAVHDAARKAEQALRGYEEKLGLVSRFKETSKDINKAMTSLDGVMAENADNQKLVTGLGEIKSILGELELIM